MEVDGEGLEEKRDAKVVKKEVDEEGVAGVDEDDSCGEV